MKQSTAARLAGLLAVLLAALITAGLWLSVLNNAEQLRTNPVAFVENTWLALVFYVYGGVGAFVVARRPQNAIGWILLAVALLVAVALVGEQYAIYSLITRPGALPGTTLAAWVSFPAWMLAIGLLFTFLLLLFPTGRLPSPRWRPVSWAAGGLIAAATALTAFSPYIDPPHPDLVNPFAIPGLALPPESESVLLILLALCAMLCATSLLARFRSGGPEQRQQLKWFLYAAGLLAAGTLLEMLGNLGAPALLAASYVVLDVGYTALPVAVGIAVLRYRLWDIDLLIRRTLVYAALTAALAAVYLGSVVVLQSVLRLLTGQAQSQLVTVLSTLAIAALFTPLRRRVQHSIDRRFYRRKYDAARILAGFASNARDETDLERLNAQLVAAVEETLEPAHVSLWVRNGRATEREKRHEIHEEKPN